MNPPSINRESFSTRFFRCGRRVSALVLFAMVAVSQLGVGRAQAFEVCARNCGTPPNAACVAAIAACEVRIHAYNIYMGQMGAGQQKRQLPSVYRDILSPQYPQINFNTYRFGFADRQPPNNATTDCADTWFNSQPYVDALAAAGPNADYFWLLHELTHVEQCTAIGGRERYANRWWNEMTTAATARGMTINFIQPPEALAAQIGTVFAQVHDIMPMELAASAKGELVAANLRKCCIANDEKPIRPLTISGINDGLEGGGSRRLLSVTATGGDAPFKSTWRIKSPGEANFETQPQSLVRGLELLWTPKKTGGTVVKIGLNTITSRTYEIEVDVAQEDVDLDHRKATKSITLTETQRGSLIDRDNPISRVPVMPKEIPPGAISPKLPARPGTLPKPGPKPTPDPMPTPGPGSPGKPPLPGGGN